MPKPLYVSELEQPAPANINNPSKMSWYNRYGGFLIETKWNSRKNQFDTIYHPYDYPNVNMPDE